MKKLKQIKIDRKKYEKIITTKYDHLFKKQIIQRGKQYLDCDYLHNFKKTNNKIQAIISNDKSYKVSIEYINRKEINVSCECQYHKETDKYCKHIYSLLLYDKLNNIEKDLNKQYKKYIEILNNIKDKFNNKSLNNYEIYLESINNKINEYNNKPNNNYQLYIILSKMNLSIYNYINVYNDLLDNCINKDIQSNIDNNKECKDISVTYTFDDSSITNYCDNVLSNVDSYKLEIIKYKLEQENEDTSIIDKAIINSKKREKEEKEERRLLRHIFFNELFSKKEKPVNKKYNYLEDWQNNLVNKGKYDSDSFEEEELEEDDYYNEDDV